MTNPDEIEEMVRELRAPVGENAPAIMEKAAFLILRLAQPTREEMQAQIDTLCEVLKSVLPILDGVRYSVGLGPHQLARIAKAKAVLAAKGKQ